MLAILLKREGHDLLLLTYHPDKFFMPILNEAGVAVEYVLNENCASRVFAMRRTIRSFQPDVGIAFLSIPSLILELAGLPYRKFGIIVSERSSRVGTISWRHWFLLNLHRLADAVVTNSNDMKKVAEKTVPSLRNRLHLILNCVDMDRFRPSIDREPVIRSNRTQFVVIARLAPGKNALGLATALRIVQNRNPETHLVVDWYGDKFYRNGQPTELSANYLSVKNRIKELNIEAVFRLKSPVADITPIYQAADAILLPTFFEGCSNVICEALACGKPVLTSDVCDNNRLVKHGVNGFLFDPHDAESIAAAMMQFASLSQTEKSVMGRESRLLAEKELSTDRFLSQYLSLIESVCNRYTGSTSTRTL